MKNEILETAREIMAGDDGQASYEEIAEMAIRRHALSVTAQSVAELASALKADDEMARKNTAILVPAPISRFAVLKQEWEAAYALAPRKEVEVQDEDGGSSFEMRVDRAWRYKGFDSFQQFIAADPQWVEEQKVVRQENVAKAKTFLAQTAVLPAQDRRKAYFALPDGVRGVMSDLLTRSQRKELLK